MLRSLDTLEIIYAQD